MNEVPITSWKSSGEVERVLWNHYDENYCIVRFTCLSTCLNLIFFINNNYIPLQVSTSNGYIEYFDVRKQEPLWQIKGHEKEVTGK